MARLKCRLTLVSESPHTYQIITGFILLQRQGIIDLDFQIARERVKQYPTEHTVDAQVGDANTGRAVRIVYDTLDGYNFEPDAMPFSSVLADVDFYFKRSFDLARHQDLEYGSRVYPLGLYYQVVTSHPVFSRVLGTSRTGLGRRFKRRLTGYYRNFSVEHFEDTPRQEISGKILFAARAWNPQSDLGERPDRFGTRVAQREEINTMRAECIRLLRQTYGERFIGGFMATPYAQKHYPEYILDDALTRKSGYLDLVKHADVCIASMGLHESNGAKLAEYVAASKAIVSERLRYTVPGEFVEGENYLEFTTPDECVAKVARLVDDVQGIYHMKCENYRYYHQSVRPDRLVLNTLLLALERRQK